MREGREVGGGWMVGWWVMNEEIYLKSLRTTRWEAEVKPGLGSAFAWGLGVAAFTEG